MPKLFWLLLIVFVGYAHVEADFFVDLTPYSYTFVNTKKTWNNAKRDCEVKESVLVKIGSESIKQMIIQTMKSQRIKVVWIGATDSINEGQWKWLEDGSRVTGLWKAGQPDNWDNNEDCATINQGGKMNDLRCSGATRKFVCQRLHVFTDLYELVFSQDQKTWTQARNECSKKNMHLMKIDTASLATVMERHSNESRWIGANDIEREGNWTWLDGGSAGKSTVYHNWNGAEPNGHNENCALAFNGKKWMDYPCTFVAKYTCQKRLPTIISRNNHAYTFNRTVRSSWESAKNACAAREARLVEIFDEATDDIIRKGISNPTSLLFSGGWLKNAAITWISGRSADYTSGWASGEPGNNRHGKIALSSTGWKLVLPTRNLSHICEMAHLSNLQVSETQLILEKESQDEITCSANGVPHPNVFWQFSSAKVTANSSESVYQAQGNGRSVLHVAKATLKDEGTYTCLAIDKAGDVAHRSAKERKNFTLTVPSTPTVVSVRTLQCSTTIAVSWKANFRARNMKHKILVKNANNASELYEFPNPSTSSLSETFNVTARKWMMYNITVTPCPNDVCKHIYSKSNFTGHRTAGLPGKAADLQVQLSEKYSCSISWTKPRDAPEEYITDYKLIVKKRLNYYPPGSNANATTQPIDIDGRTKTYTFEGKPNYLYRIGIKAKTCAGFGDIIWSNINCTTDVKAPGNMVKPTVSEYVNRSGIIDINIINPSQENGRISCLFVIVKVLTAGRSDLDAAADRNYTWNELVQANSTAEREYIALALDIARHKLKSSLSKTQTLGDKRYTTCWANNSYMIAGRNSQLSQYKNISIFVVTSTPAEDGVLLTASENAHVAAIPEPVKDIIYTDLFQLLFSHDTKSWTEAKADCEREDSHLLKIDSDSLRDVISNNSKENLWIGAHDDGSNNDWKWLDGTSATKSSPNYHNWNRAEPNGNNEHCALAELGRKWSDYPCTVKSKYVCQKVLPNIIARNNHTYIFHRSERVDWSAAKKACSRKGSSLVEIYDEATDDLIRDNIWDPNIKVFSGGNGNNGNVTWDSGKAAVYTTRWATGESTTNQPSKITLSVNGWKSVLSSEQLPYICEMANLTSVSITKARLTIGGDSEEEVTCSADGVPLAKVRWEHSSAQVTTTASDSVYQVTGIGTSVLHVAKATLVDEGIYTCVGENQAGNFSGTPTLRKDFQLTVPSTPEFVVAEAGKCSSTLTIDWKPNARAQNVEHKITITNTKNASEIYKFSNTSTTIRNNAIRFNVTKWMMYNVTVTPCPNDCEHSYAQSNYTRRRTSGLPGIVGNLKIQLSNKSFCTISWDKPKEVPAESITNYTVSIKGRLYFVPRGSRNIEGNESTVTGKQMTHSFIGKPNFRYEYGIRAKTCVGFGDIIWSNDSCVTDAKSPESVAKPQVPRNVNSNGTMKIKIDIPSQQNGAISCLFVIVKAFANERNALKSSTETNYTLYDLVQANASNKEYIALALNLNRSGIGKSLTCTLGNETVSKCDISSLRQRQRLGISKTFVGQNLELNQYKNISVFIVTSTPTRDDILLKRSNSTQVLAVPKPVNDSIVYSSPYEFTFVTKSKIWKEARLDCEARKGVLVKIDSNMTTQIIMQNFPAGHSNIWIGFKGKNRELKWLADGKSIVQNNSYSNWASENVSDKSMMRRGRDCAVVRPDGQWEVSECSTYRRGFVCQRHIIFTDQYLLLMSYDERNWTEAKAKCSNEGMHLVKIDSSSLMTKLPLNGTNRRWIGASYSSKEADWIWLDKTSAMKSDDAYRNWAAQIQRNNSKENGQCAAVKTNKKWIGIPCSKNKKYICQKRLTIFTDQYQLYFSHYKKNWTQAATECTKKDSHLIKIDSDALTTIISNNSNESRWTGASYNKEQSRWQWLDGTQAAGNTISYRHWDLNEPSNENHTGNEKCVIATGDGRSNDVQCSGKHKFICQKSLPTTASHGNHSFIFYRTERVNWDTAKTVCASRGSRLVEIYDEETNEVIRNKIWDFDAEFFCGGNKRNGSVTWEIGGTVTYTPQWAVGMTHGIENNKIALSIHGWKDVPSSKTLPYICEMANLTVISLSNTTMTVGNGSAGNVICSADGVPFSKVFWKFSSATVTLSVNESVYQARGSGRSLLSVQNATLPDEGTYNCIAENQAGNFTKTLQENFTLTVPSYPDIILSEAKECSSTIVVKWTASRLAQNVEHKIVVTNAENGNETYESLKHPKSVSNKTVTFKVTKWTMYNVTVTPCPDICKEVYTVSSYTRRRTVGLPGKADTLNVRLSNKYSCRITWEKPNEDPDKYITAFKVTLKGELQYLPIGRTATEDTSEIIVNETMAVHLYEGKPNYRYMIGIQVKTCAGFGEILWSNESCLTNMRAPEIVTKPVIATTLTTKGKMKITINIPSQESGPISCIFVIVKVHAQISNSFESAFVNKYTRDNLTRANATSEKEYIAIALTINSVVGNNLTDTLGDERATTCDLSSAATRPKRSAIDNTFVGRNSKLDPYKDISVFIVTSTPTNGIALLKASESVEVKAIPKPEDSKIIPIITAAVGGGVFLIVLLAVIIVILKKKRTKPDNHSSPPAESPYVNVNTDEHPYEMMEIVNRRNNQRPVASKRRTQTDIPMKEFETTYNTMNSNEGAAFTEQFKELVKKAKGLPLSVEFASNPELASKNRYKNILPFDETRVPIRHNDDGYINACFIDGFEQKMKFIATQGPVSKTVDDFWLMIVEQKVTVIVMLAQCIEAGKKKCEKYWPDPGRSKKFGFVMVSNVNEVRFCGYISRTLRIKAKLEGAYETTVSQYHFLTWPDHGFPLTTSHMSRMYQQVMRTHEDNGSTSPIAVHCSAGAGRTGTFIGYDYILNESKSVGNADVFECVSKMRRQRIQMVQNCDQYILVHKLLLETHVFRDTDISRQEALQKFADPIFKRKATAEGFANLSRVKPMDMTEKGTDEKISAYDRMKVKLFEGESDIAENLHGSFVEAYDDGLRVIVSRPPSESEVEVLWKLSINLNIRAIVMITENEHESVTYWDGSKKRGKLTIRVDCEEKTSNFIVRKLTIQGSEKKTVTHLHLKLDSTDSTSRIASKVNKCVARLQKELRQSYGAALIHCKTGKGMSGVFCAMMNILERMAIEDRVDVFRAVKDLRDCKEGMVETVEQYRICYDGVLEYLRDFDTYSNFQ